MFEPKGKKPMWELVYDYVVDKPIGEILTFEELSEAINEDIMKNRNAVYKARKKLATRHKKFLVTERGAGYKVVEGMEQLDHAQSRHVTARRQSNEATFEVANIKTEGMNQEQKNDVRAFIAWNATVVSAFSNQAKRVHQASAAVNEKLEELTHKMDTYSDKMEQMADK